MKIKFSLFRAKESRTAQVGVCKSFQILSKAKHEAMITKSDKFRLNDLANVPSYTVTKAGKRYVVDG